MADMNGIPVTPPVSGGPVPPPVVPVMRPPAVQVAGGPPPVVGAPAAPSVENAGIPVAPVAALPHQASVPAPGPAVEGAPGPQHQSAMDVLLAQAREKRVVSTAPVTAPAASAAAVSAVEDANVQFDLNEALTYMIEQGGSDLHVTVGIPPTMRLNGSMTPVVGSPTLNGDMIHDAIYGILTSQQQAVFEEMQELDLAYTMPGVSRFRVNVLMQRTEMAAVFRAIPWDIKSLDSLGMPSIVSSFAQFERGFVLITGPTGSGKSTTLAAVLDEINRTRSAHIMTIEDPIEFIHAHKKSVVNQREVGADTHSFKNALKHVLRQDPDVILVGELRDLETISVALTAAETGHLVLATLHTQSAQETVSRIVDVFPPDQQSQVQTQLAATLKAVLCQTLVKKRGGGRVAATEIMVVDDGIANQIRKGSLHQIQSSLQTGASKGMQTLDKHLAALALNGVISFQDGWDKASDRSEYSTLTGGEAEVARTLASRTVEGGTGHRGSM